MRPRRIRRGSAHALAVDGIHATMASMRPRRIRRGSAARRTGNRPRSPRASMRPRRIRRGSGRVGAVMMPSPSARGFNEAPANSPGIGGRPRLPHREPADASMRPRRIRRGSARSRGSPAAEWPVASMRPRRIRRGSAGRALGERRNEGGFASMRPRRIRRRSERSDGRRKD